MSSDLEPGSAPAGSVGALLASDRERDQLVERLSAACADGRLDLAAFSDRLEAALSARTRADIKRLEADLGQPAPTPVAVSAGSGTSWFVGIMSSAVRKGRWVLQPRSHALALMGECTLDLRGAEVLASHSHINAVAIMGSIHVIVPEGIDVDLDGLAIMGAKSMRIGTTRPLPGSPVIRVTALALMGEVSVVAKAPKGQPPQLEALPDRYQRRLHRHQRRLDRRRHWGGDDQD